MYELSVLGASPQTTVVTATWPPGLHVRWAARRERPSAAQRNQARSRRRITRLPDRGVADQPRPGGGVSAEGHARGEDGDAADRSRPAEADVLASPPVALFAEEG
jgi:hypothetical protein